MFKSVAENTRTLYLGTEFNRVDDFAVMLRRLAKTYEARQPQVYHQRLLEIKENFPNVSFKEELDRQINLIKTRLNTSMAGPGNLHC
jgi:hypothetical protein